LVVWPVESATSTNILLNFVAMQQMAAGWQSKKLVIEMEVYIPPFRKKKSPIDIHQHFLRVL